MSGRPWTQRELDMVDLLYPEFSTAGLAADMDRTVSAVHNMAHARGLQKSDDYLHFEGIKRGVTNLGAEHRFQPGHATWNKGKPHSPPGSERGRFKPGNRPQTWQPVGSYRIADGVLQRKINDESGHANRRWRSVHELVWIEHHGPVPEGHIVVFRRGLHTQRLEEITIDRLECITRGENMRRNSYHRYPQPIPQLIQLRGAMNRKINRRRREANDEKHN